MTIVDNCDGTYIATDPRDHCKHGVYVGGCGYDFMCHACEMGDPDPTINEMLGVIVSTKAKKISLLDNLRKAYANPGYCEIHAFYIVGVIGQLWNPLDARIAAAENFIKEIKVWTDDPDDDNWMNKRHMAEIRSYMEQTNS